MVEISVYGASDDVLVADGAVKDEWYIYNPEHGVIEFSTGTRLHVKLDDDGAGWTVRVLEQGDAVLSGAPRGTRYARSEHITVHCSIEWVQADDGGQGVRRVTL